MLINVNIDELIDDALKARNAAIIMVERGNTIANIIFDTVISFDFFNSFIE